MNAHATFKPKIQPYDYQEEAIANLFRCWEAKDGNGHLIVLPVGGGKTIVCSAITHRCITQLKYRKVLILTHVSELIVQNYSDLRAYWPQADVGIFSAGLGRKDHRTKVVVGGVQSVARNLKKFGHVDVIIVDEAHLIPHEDDGQYREVIRHCRAINPACKLVGLTGTPYRLNSGNLLEAYKDQEPMFDTIVHEMTIPELVERQKLCRMTAKSTKTKLDLTGVRKIGGEYNAGQLDTAVNSDKINAEAVEEIVKSGDDRRSWLIFAISIGHAERLRDLIRSHGITCEAVHSKLPKNERKRYVDGYKSFRIRCLVNVGCLTTGFNHPPTDLLAFLRPTMSPGLYVQMAGRGIRTAPDKQNCLVLDFAGLVTRHGLVDAVRGVHKRKGEDEEEDEPKVKECFVCSHLNPPGTKICEECGFTFPAPKMPTAQDREAKLNSKPVAGRVMSAAEDDRWVNVVGAMFRDHHKDGSPPMVRITYRIDAEPGEVSEFLCPEHVNQAWLVKKADEIWRRRSVVGMPPKTTAEALARMNELRRPQQLLIRRDGPYFNVVSARL